MQLNEKSLDTVCAAFCYAMGIEPPKHAAPANERLAELVDKALGEEKADRVFLYNPDAVAQWVSEKYSKYIPEVLKHTHITLPLRAVMPSVTPVCFATMYTGTQPEMHGIRAYEKPALKIDTIFDALLRVGKRPVILADRGSSLSMIFLERHIDYFIYDSAEELFAKAAQIIMEDKYDFVVVYDESYDTTMHKNGTESPEALAALRCNAKMFGMLCQMIEDHWQQHNTLVGFATDHGCHEIDGGCGSHGLEMEEDLNIAHFYGVYKKQETAG